MTENEANEKPRARFNDDYASWVNDSNKEFEHDAKPAKPGLASNSSRASGFKHDAKPSNANTS